MWQRSGREKIRGTHPHPAIWGRNSTKLVGQTARPDGNKFTL